MYLTPMAYVHSYSTSVMQVNHVDYMCNITRNRDEPQLVKHLGCDCMYL